MQELRVERLKVSKAKLWKDSIRKWWFRFSRSPLSVVGFAISATCVALAILAPIVAPYPEHAGWYINLDEALQPPSLKHPFGTDHYGRDVLSRVIFGMRYSFILVAVVLPLVIPTGVILGVLAGYFRGSLIDYVIMRLSDIFVSVPPLVMALAIASVMKPSMINSMIAVSITWWPWYARLAYSAVSSQKNEYYVIYSEITGMSKLRIMFKEILPNCLGPILTKATLDVGWVILVGAALSFVGLGAQPPTPDLGTMVAEGSHLLPASWWVTIFPAMTISIIILGFNLLGDGIKDIFTEERY